MKWNKLAFDIHFALMYPEKLKYWDLPTYSDTGLPYPAGVFHLFYKE